MDFHAMKRDELRELCKKHKIPANLKNLEMANRLASLFKIDNEKPKQQRLKSCLRSLDDERNSEGKEAKKVRISPQNQTFEFEKTNPRAMRLAYRTRKSMVIVEDKINNGENVSALEDPVPCPCEQKASENVSVDNQLKSTKTRGRGRKPKQAEVVEPELLPKKMAQETDVNKRTSRKRTSGVVDLVAVRPEKAMKNTESEAKPVVRRSVRNVEKPVDSAEQVEILKLPKRKTRSDSSVNQGEEKATTKCLKRNTSKDTGEKAVEEAIEQEKEKAKVTRNTRRQKRDTGLNGTVPVTESASVVEQCQQRRSTRNATKSGKVEPEESNDKKSDAEVQERGVSLRNKQPRKQEKSRRPVKSDGKTESVGKRKLSTVKHVEDLQQTDPLVKSVDSVDISEAADIQNMLCNDFSAVEDDQGKNQSQHQTTSPTMLLEECEFRNAEERLGGTSAEFKELAEEEAKLTTESSNKKVVSAKQPENSDGETTEVDKNDEDTFKEEEYNEAEILNGDSSEDAEIVLLPSSVFKSSPAVSTVSRSSTEDSKAEMENSASKVDCRVQSDTNLTSTSIHRFTGASLPVCEPGFQGIYETQDETAIPTSLKVECEPNNGEVSLIKSTELEALSLCVDTIMSSDQVQLTCTNGIVDCATAKENQSGDMLFISRDEGIIPDFCNQEGQILSNNIADLKSNPILNELQSRLHKPADTPETSSMVSNELVDSQADKCIDHLDIHECKNVGYIQDTEGVTPKAMVDEKIERSEGIDTCISDRSDDPAEHERNHKQEFEEESNLQTIHEEINGIAADKDSVVSSNEPEGRNMIDAQLNDSHEDADLANQNLEVHEEKAGNIVGNVLDSEEVLPSATVDERTKGIDTFSSDNSDDTAGCEGSHKQGLEEASNSQFTSGKETYDTASSFQSEYAEDDIVVTDNGLEVRNAELNNNHEDTVLADQNLDVHEVKAGNVVGNILEAEKVIPSAMIDGRSEGIDTFISDSSDDIADCERSHKQGLEETTSQLISGEETFGIESLFQSENAEDDIVGVNNGLEVRNLIEVSDVELYNNHEDAVLADQNLEVHEEKAGSNMGNIQVAEEVTPTAMVDGRSEGIDTFISGGSDDTSDSGRSHWRQGLEEANSQLTSGEETYDIESLFQSEYAEDDIVGINNELNNNNDDAADLNMGVYEEKGKSCRETHEVSGRLDDEDVCMEEAALTGLHENSTPQNLACSYIDGNSTIKAHSASTSPSYNSNNEMEFAADIKKLGEFTYAGYEDNLAPQQSAMTLNDDAFIDEAGQSDQQNLTEMSTEPISMQGCGHMDHTITESQISSEDESRKQKDVVAPNVHLFFPSQNEQADASNKTQEDSGKVASLLKDIGAAVSEATQDGVAPNSCPLEPEPADDPMDWEDYGSNAKIKAALIVLQGSEEKSVIQSSVEEANISDENANYDESRATLELIAPSPEAMLPVDSANQTEPEDDLIGLVVLERIAEQTEQQSSGENFSLTSEPQEGDGENYSLAPKPEEAEGEKFSLPEPEEADGENFSLAPKPEEAVGEKFSLPEPEEADGEKFSLPEPEEADGENFSLPETEEADGENFSLPEPEESDGKNLSFTPEVEGADGKNFSLRHEAERDNYSLGPELEGADKKEYEEAQIHNQYTSEDLVSVIPCSGALKNFSLEEAREVTPKEKVNERLEGVCVDSLTIDILDYKDGSVGSYKQGPTKESNQQLFGREDTNCGILESKVRLCLEGESIQRPGLMQENSESMEIELTSYETALFMGDDNFGDKAGTLDYQTSEMNLMISNIDVGKNKEDQISTEQVESDDISKQGCDSSELTLLTSVVCDKDESMHQKDDVPTGDFFVPCQAEHENLSHPEHCKVFDEVTGKIDPVLEDENASIDQAKEDVLDLMKEDRVLLGSVDEICFTAETLEGGNEKMEASECASFPEMRSVIPEDEYKNADLKGISNEDLFQGSEEDCLSRSVAEANPTAENMESDDLGVTFQLDAPLSKEYANMHENTENKAFEHARQETDDDTFNYLRSRLNKVVEDMEEVTMDIEQLLEEQTKQGCEEVGTKSEEAAISDICHEDAPKVEPEPTSNADICHDECKPATVKGVSKEGEGEITSQLEMKPLDDGVEDAGLDMAENSSRKPTSVVTNMKKRSILIHGTPRRPIKTADMKENSTAHLKREHHLADATELRPIARRKALGELHRR